MDLPFKYIVPWFFLFVLWADFTSFAQQIPGDPFAEEDLFSSDIIENSEGNRSENKFVSDLHGYLESRNRIKTHDCEFMTTRQRLWLEGWWGFGSPLVIGGEPSLRGFVSAALDMDPKAADLSQDHDTSRIYLEEAFVTLERPGLKFIAGNKIHRIGTGDGINPLDLINPLDHRDPFATGSSDARRPVLLGLASVNLPVTGNIQEANFDLILVPLARVNRLNSSGSAWESPGLKRLRAEHSQGSFILEDQEEPDKWFDQVEVEARLAITLSGWDLSLIGFYGYLDSPVFSLESNIKDTGKTLFIIPVHPWFSAFGFTFARGLDKSTLRGELSVKPDLPMQLADSALPGYARTTVTEGVFGIDRTFGTNLYVNLQYFYTLTHGADKFTSDCANHGMSYQMHDRFLYDALTMGFRGIAGFSGQGFTFEAYGEYQPADDWVLEASILFFQGSESGIYGQYGDNDMITLRVRYSF